MAEATAEKMEFKAEIKQLLDLMINSLYSNKEIFIRELVSNSSDAIDKIRFNSLTDDSILGEDKEFKIGIALDKEQKTITISDNGIGMDHDDIINNLGTIARSGTKAFMEQMTGDQKKDNGLIGQFGVGFYSVFMVAEKVEVLTQKVGEDQAYLWVSEGAGEFTIEKAERIGRGTSIIIHVKDGEDEFLENFRVRGILSKYSEYVSHPIELKYEEVTPKTEEAEETRELKSEVINEKPALWLRSKSDVTKEQYNEFYKHISNDFEDPLTYSHNKVEGNVSYTSLLYVPGKAPYGIMHQDSVTGLKLYVRKVFIMDECKELLPNYLRFIKGIIDSEDLPLNVSREILQSDDNIKALKKHVTSKSLAMLKKLANKDKEAYTKFWKEMGNVLKEGFYMNWDNLDDLKELLRFQSTSSAEEEEYTSLKDYVSRMKEDQKEIYYITAENRVAAESSPHLEIFKEKGIEVLYLIDPIDEWVTQSLTDFDEKQLVNITKGDIDLDKDKEKSEEEAAAEKEKEKEYKSLCKFTQKTLDEVVKEVRVSKRLKDSPCCLVADASDMGANMERIMKMSGQDIPESKKIMEINPDHSIWQHVRGIFQKDKKDPALDNWMKVLYNQAQLAEGSELKNPGEYVKLVNQLLSDKIK